MSSEKEYKVLATQVNWKDLWFYQKSEVLFQLTFVFCERFLPKYGDRTVDQMIQAARSGKQKIVEGLADGTTSTEMMLKLLNVGRSSLKELQEDFSDYLISRRLTVWDKRHERFDAMLTFCKTNNLFAAYEPYLTQNGQ